MRLASEIESRGGATVHRFTHDSIRRALDAGWTAADVLDTIRRSSRTPLPQPLEYLVTDVARKHGVTRVGNSAAYVRSDDEAVLDAMLATRDLAPLRLRRIAPTVLVSSGDPGCSSSCCGSTASRRSSRGRTVASCCRTRATPGPPPAQDRPTDHFAGGRGQHDGAGRGAARGGGDRGRTARGGGVAPRPGHPDDRPRRHPGAAAGGAGGRPRRVDRRDRPARRDDAAPDPPPAGRRWTGPRDRRVRAGGSWSVHRIVGATLDTPDPTSIE